MEEGESMDLAGCFCCALQAASSAARRRHSNRDFADPARRLPKMQPARPKRH